MAKNSFQELISSRARSIAKQLSHETVDAPHVMVAIAETVLEPEQRKAHGLQLRARLSPRGSSVKSPTLSDEAEKLIADCPDPRTALILLKNDRPSSDLISESGSKPEPIEQGVEISVRNSDALLAELDGLVGLQSVKRQLRKVVSVVEANRVRIEAGQRAIPQSLHLVFTGNPGTGKTTVARLVAELYGSTGALRGSRFKEATRADLVAPYVGQTSQQTERVIKSVTPGVLFIDEAYSLTPSHHGDYAEEVLATIVKNMEDRRKEFAVIAAGYKDEMSTFVNSNPGLRSRFQTFIHFEDYTTDELLQIYRRFAADAGIRLAGGVESRVAQAIGSAAKERGFGNARFIRSLWEESYANMAVRASADGTLTRDELEEIQLEDIPAEGGPTNGSKRKIGF